MKITLRRPETKGSTKVRVKKINHTVTGYVLNLVDDTTEQELNELDRLGFKVSRSKKLELTHGEFLDVVTTMEQDKDFDMTEMKKSILRSYSFGRKNKTRQLKEMMHELHVL